MSSLSIQLFLHRNIIYIDIAIYKRFCSKSRNENSINQKVLLLDGYIRIHKDIHDE